MTGQPPWLLERWLGQMRLGAPGRTPSGKKPRALDENKLYGEGLRQPRVEQPVVQRPKQSRPDALFPPLPHNRPLNLQEDPSPEKAQPRSSPISKLPPEILIVIFRELSDPTDVSRLDGFKWMLSRAFIGVCYRWRSVALSDSCLWTTVPLNVKNPRVYCERSNGLPLRILFRADSLWGSYKTHIVLDNAWRIKALIQIEPGRVRSAVGHENSFVHSSFAHTRLSLPLLEEIHVHPGFDGWCSTYELLHESSAVIRAPNLRRISISKGWTAMSWHGIKIPQLRSLDIGVIGAREDTYRNFIECIRASPLLEEIAVSECRYGEFDMQFARIQTDTPIKLTHLRRLRLTGDSLGVLTILWPLVFDPHTTTVELHIGDRDMVSLPSVPQGLGAHGANIFPRIKLVDDTYRIEAGFDIGGADCPFILQLGYCPVGGLPVRGGPRTTIRQGRRMCESLKLGKVRTLSLRDGDHWTRFPGTSELHAYYGWCNHVEVVEVGYKDFKALVDVLSKMMRGEGGQLRRFLPALRCIRLRVEDTDLSSASFPRRITRTFRGVSAADVTIRIEVI